MKVDKTIIEDPGREKAIRVIKFMLFSASLSPAILAGAATYEADNFKFLYFILASAGLLIGQAGGDYLYYFFTNKHTDSRDAHTKIFAGWRPFFTQILPRKRGTLYAGIVCLLADMGIGYYFYIHFGIEILWLALGGGLVAVFFTPLMMLGLKELVVFVTFGPLSLSGLYYVLTGELNWTPVLISLPLGFLVTIVAYLKGAKFDLKITSGRKMVIHLNRKLIVFLTILSYLSIVLLAGIRVLPIYSLAGLAGIFISLSVLRVIQDEASEIHDYLWAVVRSILALLVTTLLMALGFLI